VAWRQCLFSHKITLGYFYERGYELLTFTAGNSLKNFSFPGWGEVFINLINIPGY
jgi:hypothetical protein